MTAVKLLSQARADGLQLRLTPAGKINVAGNKPAFTRWAPEIRANKEELVALLMAEADAVAERAAIVEYDGRVPRQWSDGYAALCCLPRPEGVPEERWQLFIDDWGIFLDHWADLLVAVGWTPKDLCCIGTTAPATGLDLIATLRMLDGRELAVLDKDTITIRTAGGALETFRRVARPVQQRLAWAA